LRITVLCRPKQGQNHLTGGLLTAFGVVDNGRLAWFFVAVEERRRGSTLQSAGTKIATWRARKPHLSRPSIRPEGLQANQSSYRLQRSPSILRRNSCHFCSTTDSPYLQLHILPRWNNVGDDDSATPVSTMTLFLHSLQLVRSVTSAARSTHSARRPQKVVNVVNTASSAEG